MTIFGLEVLIYTISFVVPGYLISSTLASLSSRMPPNSNVSLFHFLTLSLVHNAPWAGLIYLLFGDQLASEDHLRSMLSDHTLAAVATWLGIVLASPVLSALIYKKCSDAGIPKWAWNKLGFAPLRPIPSAWDWAFERGYENLYVAVTTKDGSTVYGRWGDESFASSSQSGGDIHIEEVYQVGDDGKWNQPPVTTSITVKGDTISYVEFWGLLSRENQP
jgi:hypothetical protein